MQIKLTQNIHLFLNKLITKPKDPFIAYEWAEIQDLEKYPKNHPIIFRLHLIIPYKLVRIIIYDFWNALS